MSSLPDQDPWADDDDPNDEDVVAGDQDDHKQSGDWRNAKNMDEFVKAYNGDKVTDGQSTREPSQDADAYDLRAAQLRAQEERQAELSKVYTRGDQRPEYADATSLADLMQKYAQDGGVTSGDFTLAEDANGRLQVYENA